MVRVFRTGEGIGSNFAHVFKFVVGVAMAQWLARWTLDRALAWIIELCS